MLVGTAQDIRDLIAYRLGLVPDSEHPALDRGWRGEIVGSVLDDVLDGKISVRVDNPRDESPLRYES